ncbi:uncharacterized protein LOC131047140 isoform X2 [Cryptomeria japonica]|uniref:uncharacterized protein LOC131047140 isoform X2 n=1 Tax=Cryptomeria japonica TaxID=3369 RepID=UPI0025AD4E96|nr:uncharacterized protein LOC131047140 isoform X2 [Cryptomeria japonica]
MKLVDVSALILSVALPIGVGFIGTLTGDGGNSEWYKQLKKPPWTPPNWAFPVVWTILYAMMGVAAWRVWIHGGFENQGAALGVYLFQSAAFADIVLLWFAIAATIYLFWHVDAVAAYMLVPYIFWVTLASTLNLYIWIYYNANSTLYDVRNLPDQHSKSS